MKTQEYLKLKERSDAMRREAARLEGELRAQARRLSEEFDCQTEEEARALLKKLEAEREEKEARARKLTKKFDEKWGDGL